MSELLLVNPPGLVGRTNERTYSGGIGVSRRLKPLERQPLELPPIDVLYLAAVAERARVRVTIVDLLLENLHGAQAERLCRERAGRPGERRWLGVRLSIPSLLQDLDFAERLKLILPDAVVFVFGAVVMSTLDHWVERAGRAGIDYVLFGEPEAIFERIVHAEHPSQVQGVLDPRAYQPLQRQELFEEARVMERQAAWVRAEHLETLPRPAWHLLDLRRYAPGGRVEELGVQVQASRGCPVGCTMCPYALLEGTVWRKNDILRVVGEIRYLNDTFGIHRVRFRDPNFGFSRRYALELANALVAANVKLSAAIESSIEVFDEPTLRALRAAGVETITTGIETNDAACLASIGQKIQINDKLRARVALCHALGFHVYGTYCLGTPEETWTTVEQTWRFANELDVESGFTVMTPFPGTAMYWRALREGLLPKRMQFSSWNSYSSTVQSYALTTMDLDMARWWARMETIIPYRRRRAKARGLPHLLQFYASHAPHYAWRTACRGYVALRKRAKRGPGLARSASSTTGNTRERSH
jgi:magnesium-protoporphyrin IX monomethyl ester (oxidative) cyclase